ncbi:MAG: hypothetical protein JJ864_16605 [Rhizobiaceae bacterium]|nr:hypothetical protein [Rhizobiaceae bacterium]
MSLEDEYRIVEAISRQFEIEQRLIASRLNWNLTFQGFMIASYALVATAETSDPARFWIHGVITLVGLLVAASTWSGIEASSMRTTALRQHWFRVVGADSPFPRPFSERGGSLMGRLPPRALCASLILMWAALGAVGSGLYR